MASLLTLENIHKTFESGTVNENYVLKGLDLEVEEGDFISVIGGNGAGKSTLMNILAGNLSVDEGDLLLAGKSIKNLSVRKRAKDIARVFQDPKMGTASRLTIEENMAIALTLVMAALVKPKLLLLDEHTAALDPKTSQMVMDLTQKIVEDHQLTTLMITHDMNHAIEYGNRLIMLYQGKIVVDVKGEEKKHLTVENLMHLFQKNSGQSLVSDELVLG